MTRYRTVTILVANYRNYSATKRIFC